MMRVLVADDDADYRFLVGLALADLLDLVLVAEAARANEVIERATRTNPDLVLLDASLPGGVAMSVRLRALLPDVRVVLTSSLPLKSVGPTLAASGAVGVLAKDVPVKRIPDALRELGALAVAAERAITTAGASLPRELVSARASRRLADSVLDGWCDSDVLFSVELLVSELVANSVEHGESEVDVRIAVGATIVRVEVTDHDPALPVRREVSATSSRGRGMHIVDKVALRWGVQPRRTGKCVWFELPRVERATVA
jgi:CheY-like chemotaxis protein